MSTFVSVINPSTGKVDWKLQDDQYDYHQEIARYVQQIVREAFLCVLKLECQSVIVYRDNAVLFEYLTYM